MTKRTQSSEASIGVSRQQLIHHIKEIQKRLLAIVAVLLAGMGLGYAFYNKLFDALRSPLHSALHYTSPAGSFNFVIEVCFVVGITLALPVIVYNVIMFLQPALHKQLSIQRVYFTTFSSLVLAISGAAFAFFVILPLALQFFFKFQINGLVALISASDYLNFVVNILVTFAIMFQLPLLLNTIDHVKPLNLRKLLKGEKYIVILGVVIAIIVPFAVDPVVQVLVASPIFVLYNIAIICVAIQHALKRKLHVSKPVAMATVADEPVYENQNDLLANQFTSDSSSIFQEDIITEELTEPAKNIPQKNARRTMDFTPHRSAHARSTHIPQVSTRPNAVRIPQRAAQTRNISDIRMTNVNPTNNLQKNLAPFA